MFTGLAIIAALFVSFIGWALVRANQLSPSEQAENDIEQIEYLRSLRSAS